ncbi:unnamed protein product [Dicrocoelium dendriticum]|nr:unnamed protein product [Dicrocoelium dendriticum]
MVSNTNVNSPSAEEGQHETSCGILSSFVECPPVSCSPKMSCDDRVPKIDSPHPVSSSKLSSPQVYTDESNEYFGLACSSSRDDLCFRPSSSPSVSALMDDTAAQPSSTRDETLFTSTMLSSALNCHLAPLATTWDHSPAMHSCTSTVANGHWTPTTMTDQEASSMSVTTTFSRNEPPGLELGHLLTSHPSSLPVNKSNPCHQFSVAALTDELTTNTSASSRIPHSPFGAKCVKPPNRVQRRSSAKRVPIQRATSGQLPSRETGFPPHSRTHPSSSIYSGPISGFPVSVVPATSFHAQPTVSHLDGRRPHLKSDPNSGRPPSLGSRTSSVRSPPLTHPQRHPHTSSSSSSPKASGARSWNSPAVSLPHLTDGVQSPDPRVLQHLMGIDEATAERLLANARFNNLYSLTLATLAGNGAGGSDARKHLLHNGSTDILKEGGIRSNGAIPSANTYVSSTSSPLATKMSTSTSVPNRITRSSASDDRCHETPVIRCAQPDGPDLHGFPRTSLSSEVLHRPRLSSLYSAGQHPNPGFSYSPMTSLPLPAPNAHLSELASHTNQKQWEAYFREKMLSMAVSGDSPMGMGPPNLSLSSSVKGTTMSSKVPLTTVTSSSELSQSRALFEASTTRTPLNPPSPYHVNSPHSGPLARPLAWFGSTKGVPEQTKRQLSNLLRQPAHTCGRWADAHVRIARYIEQQQLLLGSRTPCDGFITVGSTSSSSSSSRCPIRPVPCPIPPLLPRPSGPISFPTLPVSISSSQLSNPIASVRPPLNTHPSLDTRIQQPHTSVPANFVSDGPIDSNAFLSRLFNGMLSNMPVDWTSNGHFFSKEMSEMLWASALQKFYGHPVVPQVLSQSRPPWVTSGSPSSVLDLTHSARDPLSTFFVPGVRPRAPDPPGLFTPSCASIPASSYHGPLTTLTSSQSGANTKRRRLDVPPILQTPLSHPPHFDLSLVSSSLSLHPRTSRPLDVLTPAVQKHANQPNGYHAPALSDPWNPTNQFARMDANYSNCAENSLKLPAPPSHLAPIHPW